MRVEFAWDTADVSPTHCMVRERLVGSEMCNEYGPIPKTIVRQFIQARRNFVERTIKSHKDIEAHRIFTPNIPIIGNKTP